MWFSNGLNDDYRLFYLTTLQIKTVFATTKSVADWNGSQNPL